MILLHRITPLVTALVAAFGFVAMMSLPYPLISAGITLLLVSMLLSRLLKWNATHMGFWTMFGTPFVFLVSAYGFLLLLEIEYQQIALAVIVCSLLFFFVEHVFYYTHLSTRYQMHSLEHMSSVLHLLSIFFIGALGFGARMLLQTPLWALMLSFFVLSGLVLYGTLWVSKVDHARALPYALAGAVLTTEIFTVITFLPTGIYTNAALLVIFLYLFLGLTRAHFLERLSRSVVRRYVGIGSLLFALILGTAQWI